MIEAKEGIEMENNKVIVIVGPTAVGKTRVSIELAKRIGGEIISADSMQVYRYMDIGTAKPTLDEMEGIKHYLIDVVHPKDEFNAAKYRDMALECIREVTGKNKIPIIVGGTGLYVSTVVDNIEFSETIADKEYREKLQETADNLGTGILYEQLRQVDSKAAEKIHPNDTRRIIRALEVYKFTGKPISYHQKVSRRNPPEYDFIIIGLTMDRAKLYERINLRVDKMVAEGLEDEVRGLVDLGVDFKDTSMQGLGYKEMAQYCLGTKSREEVIETIKRDSRRYAKRQLTWFRRDERILWIDADAQLETILKKILNYLEAKELIM